MTRRLTLLLTTTMLILSVTATVGARGNTCENEYGHTELGDRLSQFFHKDTVTIVITDSGLGGLSVTAAVERILKQHRVFAEVRLIFANALPDREHLYNQMETLEEKARVFDSALAGIDRTFRPDVILVACNTLSVVFPKTEFSRSSTVPVVGIVEFGVDLIARALRDDSTSFAIILGTPTTIGQNTHAVRLRELGFDSTRVSSQACDMLESEIQADPTSDVVRSMIEMYAGEVLERQVVRPKGELVVALCCSHYGFARSEFQEVFQSLSGCRVKIVDPNIGMGEYLSPFEVRGRFKETMITVKVVSRAEILPAEITAIAAAVRPVSSATANAVASYVRDLGLFSY